MHLKKNKREIVLAGITGGFLILAVFLVPNIGWAQNYSEGLREVLQVTKYSDQDLFLTIARIIRIVVGFVGIIALILFIYAGMLWMTSAGNPEKIARAKKIMLAVLVGILIIVLSFAITTFIIRKVEEVTGGGAVGEVCEPGEVVGCRRCKAAGNGWDCDRSIDGCLETCEGPGDRFVLKAFYPNSNQTGISLCGFIWAQFSLPVKAETVTASTFKITLKEWNKGDREDCEGDRDCASGNCELLSGGVKKCKGNTVAGDFTIKGTDVKFDAALDFIENAWYRVLITEAVRSEEKSLSLSGGAFEWNFKTGTERPAMPPRVESLVPKEGEENVCLDGALGVKFSQEMDPESLREAGAITVNPLDAGGFSLVTSRDLKAVDAYPRRNYKPLTDYTPTLKASVIKDICGNYLDGDKDGTAEMSPTDDVVWTFTTGGAERVKCPPEITEITPKEGYYDGDLIKISGYNFGVAQKDVIFNDRVVGASNCLSAEGYANRNCFDGGSWSNTEISLRIPAKGDGSWADQSNGTLNGEVRVRTVFFEEGAKESTLRISNAKNLGVKSPYIKWVSPEKEGGRGQYVTISGMNFGASKGKVYWVKKDWLGREEASFPGGSCPETWTNERIIIEVKEEILAEDYYLQVETSEGHFGNFYEFKVKDEPAGPGICGVAPGCGIIDTEVEIIGKGFGTTEGKVMFGEAEARASSWTEGKIETKVPAGIILGHNSIRVEDKSGGKSNVFDFSSPCSGGESCDPNPLTAICEANGVCSGGKICGLGCICEAASRVVTHYACPIPEGASPPFNSPAPRKGSTGNCLYSYVTAIFDTEMDLQSLTKSDNYELWECGQGASLDCSDGVSQNVWVNSSGRGIYAGLGEGPDSHQFKKNTWYQFKIKKLGVTSASGIALKDDFIWDFKTADSDSCPVQSVLVKAVDGEALIVGKGETEEFEAVVYPSNCNYAGQDKLNYSLAWSSSNERVAKVAVDAGDETKAMATGVARGSTYIKAADSLSSKNGRASLTVNACRGDVDCQVKWSDSNTVCEAGADCCLQSRCDIPKGICTPDIVEIEPNSGRVGTWTTIQGCWFGEAPGSVTFGGVDWVNPGLTRQDCGDIWQNGQVIAEVPGGAGGLEQMVLITGYGLSSGDSDGEAKFMVNNDFHPGVCVLEPGAVELKGKITVIGQGFGGERRSDSLDDVYFNTIRATDYEEWQDVRIKVVVPESSRTGVVKVKKDNFSNPVWLRVIVSLPEVEEGGTCDLSKGSPSPNPGRGAKNVCLNAVITGRFNRKDIEESTVSWENITLGCVGSGCLVPDYTVGVRDFEEVKGFEIRPGGNLTPNRKYKVTVNNIAVAGQADLKMEAAYIWEFETGDKVCEIDGISVLPESAKVEKEKTQKYEVEPINQGRCFELKGTGLTATWSSSDTGKATVAPASGLLTTATAGQTLGEAKITATYGAYTDFGILTVVGKPGIKYYWPGAETTGVCRNAVIEVIFDQLMDRSTLTGENMYLLEGNKRVAGELRMATIGGTDGRCSNSSGCTQVRFIPKELLAVSGGQAFQFRITSGVKSKEGINSDGTFWWFMVGNKICEIAKAAIIVRPVVENENEDIFVCAGRNDCSGDQGGEAGNQHTYEVVTYNKEGNPISGAVINWQPNEGSEVYEFGGDKDGAVISLTSKPKQGEDELGVEAASDLAWLTVGVKPHKVTAGIEIINWFCENPWPSLVTFPFEDSDNNCTIGTGSCKDFNFSTFYCRDKGAGGTAGDLPALSTPVIKKFYWGSQPAMTEGLLKELVFSLDRSDGVGKDVIGLRIFENDDHFLPETWHGEQGGSGSPKSIGEIDGYPGAEEGRAVYITASNDAGARLGPIGPALYTSIYLFSYNQNATLETINIFEQLLENLRFNTNVTENKEALVRDTNRLIHFSEMAGSSTAPHLTPKSLEGYKSIKGKYPGLEIGSFIKGFSVSKWESWTKELSGALGKIFVDPINKFNECPAGHSDKDCWNDKERSYVCPVGSHIYDYRFLGTSYLLRSDFEYTKYDGSDLGWDNFDAAHIQITDVCKGVKLGSSKVCGDGILGESEACERGDERFYCQATQGGGVFYQDVKQVCNNTCAGWTPEGPASCGGRCGNGIYEPAFEQCDPSSGTRTKPKADSLYNQYVCGNDCKWSTGGWCGDGIKQVGENCDGDFKTQGCILPGPGGHKGIQVRPCLANCSGHGADSDWSKCMGEGVCGDGIVSGDETCDEGTYNGRGGCRVDCTRCGDGIIQADWREACEGSIGVPTNAKCNSNCLAWTCDGGYRSYNNGCELDHCEGASSQVCLITNGEGRQNRTCNVGVHPPTWGNWGVCQVVSCNEGYRIYNNACELDHCEGGTSIECSVANGQGRRTKLCDLSKHPPTWGSDLGPCEIVACNSGYDDCNNQDTDGCETNLNTSVANCGSCGKSCQAPVKAYATCSLGQCGFSCSSGYGDCNSQVSDGCETSLSIPSNCGACGNVCQEPRNGYATCSGGQCGFSCDGGYQVVGAGCCRSGRPAYPYYLEEGQWASTAQQACRGAGYSRVCSYAELSVALDGYAEVGWGWVDGGSYGNCNNWTSGSPEVTGTRAGTRGGGGRCLVVQQSEPCGGPDQSGWSIVPYAHFVWCCR